MPRKFKRYIRGWKEKCPGYKIKRWDERNFPIEECRYAVDAYNNGKFAFVSDYARFRILYSKGGIYLDTDVELLKSLDGILDECERDGIKGFFGIERPETADVAPGLICAAEPRNRIIGDLLKGYNKKDFKRDLEKAANGEEMPTVVGYTTEYLEKHGLIRKNAIQTVEDEIRIYPSGYFNPMDMNTGRIKIEENTISIHHYASSWVDGYSRLRGRIYKLIRRFLGKKTAAGIRKIFGRREEKS
ncbi:MAG: glycosyl transferase [Lachnospiraceae bacterium]|nr:glycosyl transferase [Lachnospiraceae bacterium]